MSDDRFEQLLRDAARDYHRPPETPRGELWARIEAERRRRRAAPRVVVLRPAWRWGLGMAAVLLLGIAIGRWIRPSQQTAAPFLTPSAAQAAPSDLGYRLAAAQYLTRTETLLTGFRADARAGQLDSQFVAQARELLSSTRLLIDSPAGRDARLKSLLQDLELVLAQIALLPAVRDSADVELITQGMDQSSVLTRLRSANPAGHTPVSVQGAL
ncbi:MAG: hypothetical protein ACREMW_10715 [Gemmatimonadales bacterium]